MTIGLLIPALLCSLGATLGNLALIKGDLRSAETCFLNLAEWEGEVARASWGLGQIAQRRGEHDLARIMFDRVVVLSSDRVQLAELKLGESLAAMGRWDDALAVWRDARAAGYFRSRGDAARRQRQWDEAVAHYDVAWRIAPLDGETIGWLLYSRGQAAMESGAYAAAAACFRGAVVVESRNFDAHLALGVALQRLGQLDQAEAALSVARNIRPNSFWPLFYLGKIQHQRGEHLAAITLLKEAIRRNADYAPAHILLARAYRGYGAEALAIHEYLCAIRLDPGSSEVWGELKECIGGAERDSLQGGH